MGASNRVTRFVDEIAAGRRQWRARYGPAAAAAMEAVSNLVRVRELVVRDMEGHLAGLGMSHVEYDVLTVIAAGDGHGVRLGQIGRRAQKFFGHQTSITNVVLRLADRAYVVMDRDPDDQRATRVRLTPDGSDQLRAANDALTAARFGLGALTTAELTQLTGLLLEVRASHGDVSP